MVDFSKKSIILHCFGTISIVFCEYGSDQAFLSRVSLHEGGGADSAPLNTNRVKGFNELEKRRE